MNCRWHNKGNKDVEWVVQFQTIKLHNDKKPDNYIKATKSWTIHTLYVTVSKGSNNLQHWSSINGSHVWIINISGSLGLFLSEPVSLSYLTLSSFIMSPDSHTFLRTIHSIPNLQFFTGIQLTSFKYVKSQFLFPLLWRNFLLWLL